MQQDRSGCVEETGIVVVVVVVEESVVDHKAPPPIQRNSEAF